MRLIALSAALVAILPLASCSSSSDGKHASRGISLKAATKINSVRTTAYTHSEADHRRYGAKSALGSTLKYGTVRSAAADWSVYPVGTVFQIEGEPHLYEVDDYGSALVGTNTIDLYKPSRTAMNTWGTRSVNIKVLRWGSFTKSLSIMRPRASNEHIRKMVNRIEKSS